MHSELLFCVQGKSIKKLNTPNVTDPTLFSNGQVLLLVRHRGLNFETHALFTSPLAETQ